MTPSEDETSNQIVKTEPVVKTEVSESSASVNPEKSAAGESSASSGLKTCPQCPFTTYDQSHMTVHIRKHTGSVFERSLYYVYYD